MSAAVPTAVRVLMRRLTEDGGWIACAPKAQRATEEVAA